MPPAATATPTSSCCCSSTTACSRATWRRRWSDRRRPTTCGRGWRRSAARRRPFPTIRRRSSSTGEGRITLARAAVTRAARLVPLLVRLQEALAPTRQRASVPAGARRCPRRRHRRIRRGRVPSRRAGDRGLRRLAGRRRRRAPSGASLPAPADPLRRRVRGRRDRGPRSRWRWIRRRWRTRWETRPCPRSPAPPSFFSCPRRHPGGATSPERDGCSGSTRRPALRSAASRTPWARLCGEALTELAAVERRAFPDDERVDVAFTPSAALAALAAHPPIRSRALALTHWTSADTDLAVRDLALVADPAAPAALVAAGARDRRRDRRPLLDHALAARPGALGDRPRGPRPPDGRVEPPAPARPLGAAAGAVRRAGVRAASLDRRVRRPAGQLAPPRGVARGGTAGPAPRWLASERQRASRASCRSAKGTSCSRSICRPPTPRTIWPGTSACSRSGHRSTPSSIATDAGWKRWSWSSPRRRTSRRRPT